MVILTHISFGVGLLAIAIILRGAVAAVVGVVACDVARRGRPRGTMLRDARLAAASYLLLGLEVLIAADIIRTIVQPTLEELGTLGAIVAIRTVFSYFLERELAEKGRASDD